jgi:aminotransferase
MEAIFAALLTILDPGDEVILPSPGFGTHTTQVLLAGGRPRFIPLLEEETWKLDVKQIEKVITSKTKALIITHPSNPTGALFEDAVMNRIAEIAIRYGIYLILDYTYHFLVFDRKKIYNPFLLPGVRDRLISCYSLSKEYAMTGWRVGYILAEASIIQHIAKIHDALVVSTPHISQIAALAALEGPQDCVEHFRAELEKRRNIACQRLDRLKFFFEYSKPKGTFYIFPRIKRSGIQADQFVTKLLQEANVFLVPGNAFGPGGENHVRLCFAPEREEIKAGFDRLEQFLLNDFGS